MPKQKTRTRSTGEQIRLIREARGWSLSDVERRSARAIKASVLGAYERDERHLSVERAAQLAAVYSVSLQVLLFATPTRPITRFVLAEVVA